jgi:hypothetical protein
VTRWSRFVLPLCPPAGVPRGGDLRQERDAHAIGSPAAVARTPSHVPRGDTRESWQGHERSEKGTPPRVRRTLSIPPADIEPVYWHTPNPDSLPTTDNLALSRMQSEDRRVASVSPESAPPTAPQRGRHLGRAPRLARARRGAFAASRLHQLRGRITETCGALSRSARTPSRNDAGTGDARIAIENDWAGFFRPRKQMRRTK